MSDIMAALGGIGLIPVVKIERVEDAAALGAALKRGGLPCAEVTFRTAAAQGAIAMLARAHPDLVVGAGTVLSVEQAQQAQAAGARFIVSPGFSPKVVDWCLQQGLPVLPGVVTPTEIMAGLERGLRVFKFFPAEAYGGITTLKALSAPFAGVHYIPTGGITASNLADYLSLPAVHAVGGSWMVEGKLISSGQFDEIARLAAEACAVVRRVRSNKS
jgi:2-dehydro-3-deoxyphosphogluconate aldolase/(4S)-4-hydroxy-2-oxoglutarate aldolase